MKTLIANWIKRHANINNSDQSEVKIYASNMVGSGSTLKSQPHLTPDVETNTGITIKVMPANGGKIIQTSVWNRLSDRYTNSTYVLHSDAELGKELEKIITMELLK